MAIASPTQTQQRWKPSSLQGRLLFTYLLLILLGVGGLIVWAGLHLQNAAIEQAEHDLELEALIIANALRDPLEEWATLQDVSGRALDTLTHSFAQSIDARVTLVDPTLHVLISSDELVVSHLEHEHPEIIAARNGTEQHSIRWDEWRSEDRIFVAAPILDEDQRLLSIVQLSKPMAPVRVAIHQTWLALIGVGSAILMATALVSLLLARQIARPVHRLTAVTEAMASGTLDQQVTPEGPDEIRRLGRSFNLMAGQVKDLLAQQQIFVANAAHELRSPLASLLLRVEMLSKHGANNPELSERYLRQMGREVAHLSRLVDHLLMLSRVDAGQAPAKRPLDLAPTLYELAEELGPLAEAAGLHLQLEVPAHLPAVTADSESLRIALRNVLDNAISYTPTGGRVTLTAWAEEQPVLMTGAGDAGRLRQPRQSPASRTASGSARVVLVEIRDTGYGIPASDLPHIFERFYRVRDTRANRPGGTGLGLSLVRSIVQAHGGQVAVSSALGHGTTFTIHLPVTVAPVLPAAAS